MDVKTKPKLLREIANSVNSPWEFIEALAALEGLSMQQVAEKAGITAAHYYVSKNQKSMGISVALKFSNAFEIDPNILNRVLADFNLRKIINRQQ